MSGVFITFEGGEGCGKSTQAMLFAQRLREAGLDVVLTREPGGTVAGERIREIVLDPATGDISPRAELLLYEASRAQHVAEVIAPALERGAVVLCDRFADSSTAYQGYARGLGPELLERLNEDATGGLVPERTIVIDIDPALGLVRATGSGADRLEAEDLAFHERVREGYLAIARAEPQRVSVVDGNGSVAEVAERVARALTGVEGLPVLPAAEEPRA